VRKKLRERMHGDEDALLLTAHAAPMLRCGMGERPTILLADDEEAITAELQPFLERAGFTVLVARDGEAALAASLDGDPDLIVLDVLMPGLDGREVLRRLRAGGRFNPVVLLTQVGAAG
jgi:DNA-binding response OmpR family regulator